MIARVWTMAHLDGREDVEFPSLRMLAAYIVGCRSAMPHGADGQPPEIVLVAARLAGRRELEAACVSVRARVDAATRGASIGYAILPDYRFITDRAVHGLMDAILAAEDEALARTRKAVAA